VLAREFTLAAATLWKRELVRFWREKARVLGFTGSPLLIWLVMGSGFGDLAFFFPGALTLTLLFTAVFSTMSVIDDRKEGFLLSALVSPAPRAALVTGKLLGAATLAWLQGMILVALAPLAGLRPAAGHLAASSALLFLIALAFTGLGFLTAWKMDSAQGFHAVINLLLLPMWMVSGALFDPAGAHWWMRALMHVNPLTYPTLALRALLGAAAYDPAVVARGFLVTTAAATLFFALGTAAANKPTPRSFV